jgi:putative DNA primase/helicase
VGQGAKVPADLPATIEDRTSALVAWHAEVFGVPHNGVGHPDEASRMTDDEILTKARAAANVEHLQRLWAGDTGGYPSHSEADMALCCLLAFWTQDATQIDRLFKRSGLYRDKWDEPHGEAT